MVTGIVLPVVVLPFRQVKSNGIWWREEREKRRVSKVADAVVCARCGGGRSFEGAFAKMLVQRLLWLN